MDVVCSRPTCNKKVYVESSGMVHPYCGRTCAFIDLRSSSMSVGKCNNSNCTKQKYRDVNGTIHGYCSRTCARSCVRICARTGCRRKAYEDPADPSKFHVYCNPNCFWLDGQNLTSTKLTLLNPNDLDYVNAEKKFLAGLPNAKIQGILRIQMPQSIVHAHLIAKQQSGLNPLKMYHGTQALCDPGSLLTNLAPQCSPGTTCGICGIAREGNNPARSKHNGNMWFADNPSTSLGYCRGTANSNLGIFMIDVLAQAQNIVIVNQAAVCIVDLLNIPEITLLFYFNLIYV
ncbi:17701_t:CDS:1 [Cetraspora pellucida]|uniref:17701_t:CDS:1 n=1 Tax=Cetraspora pellucida TaxID=1433469 RepID=A0A9N9HNH5_9GLOM|nr:17701_t:CDS:1 [Cetraspora pellucida]